MRITELLEEKDGPTISFEMTRPKTPKGEANIGNVLDKMVALEPDFFTMTFGAGGLTRDASMEMLHRLITERKQVVMAHLAGYGMSPESIDETIEDFEDIGVENLVVIRGDKPQAEDFEMEKDSFSYASDIIKHIRSKSDMCIAAAAYPEGHIEAPDLDADLERVKQKMENGADLIITQYFYDNNMFHTFLDKCRKAEITVPIIAGVMPIYSIKMMNILASLCGATITEEVNEGLDSLPEDDKAAVNEWGIEFAIKQCTELVESGVDGLHFYTLNRSSSVTGILNGLRENGVIG